MNTYQDTVKIRRSPIQKLPLVQTSSPRVLICEDDPATLLQLKYTFMDQGCQVKALALGNSAFHCLESEEFDLVLMDFSMPFKRADEIMGDLIPWRRISTPFVLISAEDHRADAKELGFQAFYYKPITVGLAEKLLHDFVPQFLTKRDQMGEYVPQDLEILNPEMLPMGRVA